MKFLFIGDRHNCERVPTSRLDQNDFIDHCIAKDNEIIQIAKENHVAAILQAGDFWTDADKKPSNDFVVATCKRWMNIIDDEGKRIPLYGIAGNHDLIGENEASLAYTTAGMLDSLNVLKLISDPLYFTDEDGTTIAITSASYHKGMDTVQFTSDYLPPKMSTDVHIHMVHGMLEKESLGKLIRHTCIDSILNTNADITLCGHDHVGFGYIKKDDKHFVNPGAVVRLNCSKKEMERSIKVALIEINKKDIKINLIPLKSVLDADKVFDRSEIDANVKKNKKIASLKEQADSFNVGTSTKFDEILNEIYDEKKIDATMQTKIEKDVNEKLKTASALTIVKKDIKIKSLRIKNFQSHKDTIINFNEHLNVIVGESRNGKSAILRALRWVIENKPSGKSYIRTGSDNAQVDITLSDGTIISRFITNKDNGYKFYMPDGTVEVGNTKAVTKAQELLGFSYLEVEGSQSPIPLNFLRQGDSWYLIGDKYSGSDRARIIGTLKNTNTLDAIIKDIDRLTLYLNQREKTNNIEIANLKLEEDQLQEQIEHNLKVQELFEKQLKKEQLEQFLNVRAKASEDAALYNRIIKEYDELKIAKIEQNINNFLDKKVILHESIETMKQQTKVNVESDKIIEATNKIDNAEKTIYSLHDKIRICSDAQHNYETVMTNQEITTKNNDILLKTELATQIDITEIKTKLARLESLNTRIAEQKKAKWVIERAIDTEKRSIYANEFLLAKEKILETVEKVSTIQNLKTKIDVETKNVKTNTEKLQTYDQKLLCIIREKADILAKNHICPTCMTPISEKKTEQLIENMKKDVA